MPAKLTLHPPDRAARYLVLQDGDSVTIGREPECNLVLEDPRVSKRHARLSWFGGGWTLADLHSKNGTSVNGRPAWGAPLDSGAIVSFGGLMGRFEHIDAAAATALGGERLARLQTSAHLRRRLRAELEPIDLLRRFLDCALEATSTERGLVLVAEESGLRAEVAVGFSAEEIQQERFAWSTGALTRALEARAPVVVEDAQQDPFLARRESVISGRLSVICCVPLFHGGQLAGLIYLDSRQRGATLAELDVEILQSLAEHTALTIGSAWVERRLRRLERPLAEAEEALLRGLTRRLAPPTPLSTRPEAHGA